MKEYVELITIILDIVGLTLISLNLFNIRAVVGRESEAHPAFGFQSAV